MFLINPSPTESGLVQTGPEAGIIRHLLVAPVAEHPLHCLKLLDFRLIMICLIIVCNKGDLRRKEA